MKNIRVIKINIGSLTAQQTILRKEAARLIFHKYNRAWLGQFVLRTHFKVRFDLHSLPIENVDILYT